MATAWLFGLHLVAWPGSRGVFDLAASITWALIISRLETLSSSSYLTLRPDNSLGVSKDRPSIDSGSLRPLRCFCLEEVAFLFYFHTSACLCHRAGPVPPSRFLTALMACSARSFAGLLHPAADPGVRRVSGFCLGSLAGSRVSAVPVGASTLRSLSLASRRLPVCPSWESLPSCRSLLPG
jgi:hypothetical protein